MGSGCAVGYAKASEIEGSLSAGVDWMKMQEDGLEDVSSGGGSSRRGADITSKRKIEKVKALLADDVGEGKRLGDSEAAQVLRSASSASLQYGYKRFVEECINRIEFSEEDTIRAVAPPQRGLGRKARRGGGGAGGPLTGRRAATRVLSHIDDDDDDGLDKAL
jgi:hypothetical protein